MLEFREVTLQDKELIDRCFDSPLSEGCDCTFVNVFLWSCYYQVKIAVLGDVVIFKSGEGADQAFAFPAGKGDLKPALQAMKDYAKAANIPFRLYNITEKMKTLLEAYYPGQFSYEEDRDAEDYVYNRTDLAELRGKKYHGKRNHINNFKLKEWSFEALDNENRHDCWQMNVEWCQKNGCVESDSARAEYDIIKRMLANFETLGLVGGVLRQEGHVVAFTVGERLNDSTFVVHFEKAFSDVAGAYPTVNQEFVKLATEGYEFINREEDMGIEGLRKAKLSYRPSHMVVKYHATACHE